MGATPSPPEEQPDVTVPAPPARVAPPSAVVAAPGSAEAVAAGCSCSVLANAGYRIGVDAAPLLDPGCPLDHG
jgi:hypothetical protein